MKLRVALKTKTSNQQGRNYQRNREFGWENEEPLNKKRDEPCKRRNLVQVRSITYSHTQRNETPHSRKKKKLHPIRKFEEGKTGLPHCTFVNNSFDSIDCGCIYHCKTDKDDFVFESNTVVQWNNHKNVKMMTI